jgi:uncharacterized protein YbjT (DUF2867 family)
MHMKVIVFGSTGMIGQGVLRECSNAADVEAVLAIVRRASHEPHEKVRELVHEDFLDFSGLDLSGYDACFFCLGISSAGMSEEAYRRVTYDVPMAAAHVLAKSNPSMTFIYVSGAGTDANGRAMWARVKAEAEQALLALPFAAAYMFRPAFIQPLHGITSRTRLYRAVYAVMGPLYPVWKRLFPKYVTTTEQVGRAMLHVARHGAPKTILENDDINALAD